MKIPSPLPFLPRGSLFLLSLPYSPAFPYCILPFWGKKVAESARLSRAGLNFRGNSHKGNWRITREVPPPCQVTMWVLSLYSTPAKSSPCIEGRNDSGTSLLPGQLGNTVRGERVRVGMGGSDTDEAFLWSWRERERVFLPALGSFKSPLRLLWCCPIQKWGCCRTTASPLDLSLPNSEYAPISLKAEVQNLRLII